jgi:hypothetical protein
MRTIPALVLAAAVSIAGIDAALACACCTDRAQRTDIVQPIDDRVSALLEMVSFRKEAKLAQGSSDDGGLKGLRHPGENFAVSVTWTKERITFSLHDEKGRGGTLSLLDPHMIAIFEVDPHSTPDGGLGPGLYKEWRITTRVTGDGLFRDNVGPTRSITLILHGHGNSCTDVSDFGHWSLHVRGGGIEGYAFYGELASGERR